MMSNLDCKIMMQNNCNCRMNRDSIDNEIEVFLIHEFLFFFFLLWLQDLVSFSVKDGKNPVVSSQVPS